MNEQSLPAILTLEQAAQYLQLPVDDLRAELESQRIPGLKIAGLWRIKRAVLDRLLDSTDSGYESVATSPSLVTVANQESNTREETTTIATATVQDNNQEVNGSEKPQEENIISLPQEAVLLAPSPERVWGTVFGYNPKPKGGFGHARLPDNRIVWLDAKQLLPGVSHPEKGETVEFELHLSKKEGWVARQIKRVDKSEKKAALEPAKTDTILQDSPQQLPEQASRSVLAPAFSSQKKEGQTAASLSQKADKAHKEGNYEKARELYSQAISAGAGAEVYTAFCKMEEKLGKQENARKIIQQGIDHYPNLANLYDMYGQLERRARHYKAAEQIFRRGLERIPNHIVLRRGLGQILVEIGTTDGLLKAGQIFSDLEKQGKLNKQDRIYQRFKAFQRHPRANQAYHFFQRIEQIRVSITGRRELPAHITDIVIETNNSEISESFGLTGTFLVRCFQRHPKPEELRKLNEVLREIAQEGTLVGLQDGRQVIINSSLAFIAVPALGQVRDQVMSLLSENHEALLPVDDATFQSSKSPIESLRELLGQFLGSRDLYNSTLPVSGRRFFGRERLLQELTDEVNRGQFLGIYGLRKMGKTSLIYQFRDQKLSHEAVAYVDLQASLVDHTKDCSPLYYELERDLYSRLHEAHPKAAELLRLGKYERFSDLPDKGREAKLFFTEDLRSFLDALITQKIPKIRRLVIMLDEIEKLLPLRGQPGIDGYMEFFGFLRGLAQSERYRGLLSNVVVAANAYISEQGYFDGRDNPVFSFYKAIFLQPLLADECQEMIRTLGKGMSVYWEADAIRAVFKETNGHPFLTRSLCSRITKHHSSRPLTVTANMVKQQIRPFIRDEGKKLAQITELLHHNFPAEEKLLMEIAIDEPPTNLSDESLSHLLNYHLVSAKSDGYHVTLNLLRRWLRQQAGLKNDE